MYYRLRLLYLLFTSTPDVLPYQLSHAVETSTNPLIWIRAESNRRPTCLYIKGYTTITYKWQATF